MATGIIKKIYNSGNEYVIPVVSVNSRNGIVSVTEFLPGNDGTTGQVLRKTANGYEWSDEVGAVTSVNGRTGAVTGLVESGDNGVTYIIKVSNSAPPAGTASNIITFVP